VISEAVIGHVGSGTKAAPRGDKASSDEDDHGIETIASCEVESVPTLSVVRTMVGAGDGSVDRFWIETMV
jgi:hypothetical protein